MNDFKTSGCWVAGTSAGLPDGYNSTSASLPDGCYIMPQDGLRFVDSDCITKSNHVVLDCDGVTFKLKELDINLTSKELMAYLDAIDTLTINGIKFIKES